MRAAVLGGVGERVEIEQRLPLVPGPGEAVVKLVAAALNHRDVWIRKGQYAGLRFPVVLGSDGAGTVSRVGEGVDSNWLGEKVIINPSLHWGPSEKAQDQGFRILGLPDDGTFAEETKVPASNLAKMPEFLAAEEAAALPLAGLTAFRAVCARAKVSRGDKVLVTGIGGGVASFALQFAIAAGAEVFVTSGSRPKIDAAMNLGAKGGAVYTSEDWAEGLKSQAGGLDAIVDSAGGEGFAKLIDLCNPGGRIVFFGATRGNPPELPMRKLFWKQISLLGTTMGSPDDFASMVCFIAKHRIRPVIDSRFPLEGANDALDRMERHEQAGKIVLEIGSL